jgi:MFS family permease
LGALFSIYGVVAVFSYFFGGPLADRFPARTLIASALTLTGFGGLIMASIPSYRILQGVYALFGFTTVFLFWAALIKATREWGGSSFEGRAYGWLEGGRGISAGLIATFALISFAILIPDDVTREAQIKAIRRVFLGTSFWVILLGIVGYLILPRKKVEQTMQRINRKDVWKVLKNPKILLHALIILCAYVGYKVTDDISLYSQQVLGMHEVRAAGMGTLLLWLRPVFAVLAGILTDRYSTLHVLTWSFTGVLIAGLLLFTGWIEPWVNLSVLVMGLMVAGVYALRGIYFALLRESSIPLAITGTAVGVVSVIGYTPDIFMSPLMGYLIDSSPGPQGHQHVFMVLLGFALVGLGASWALWRIQNKNM